MQQYSLSGEEKLVLKKYGEEFQKWRETDLGKEKIRIHTDHKSYFKAKLAPENLVRIDKPEVTEIYKQLWASGVWHNKDWNINNIIEKNGLDPIRSEISLLLYGKEPIEKRYDLFRKKIKGFGIASISEILNMLHPNEFCIWNNVTKNALGFLNLKKLPESFFKNKYLSGDEYIQCIDYLSVIQSELSLYQINDFFDLDIFFWYLCESVIPKDWKDDLFNNSDAHDEKKESAKYYDMNIGFWVVRAGVEGIKEQMALDNNLITIHFGLHNFSFIKTKNELVDLFLNNPDPGDKRDVNERKPQSVHYASQVWNFLKDVKLNDIIVLPLMSKQSKYAAIGIVKGAYEYKEISEDIKSIRQVEWLNKEIPSSEFDDTTLKFLRLPQTVFKIKSPHAIQNIINVMKSHSIFPQYLELYYNPNNKNTEHLVESLPKKDTSGIDDLSDRINISSNKLKEIEYLLDEKKQVIFYGPPGTSKTFVAKKFAVYFANGNENVEIIQFHPSYSYEDFIEGIKPKLSTEGEAMGFIKQPGIFKNFVDKCIKNQDKKFVLIIDEINRGNISKIFGELIYLLEYRNDKIHLTYSPNEEFFIPDNLYIIGTMNSADRSIAFVDYALRRRFYFVEFYPDSENEDVLKKWFVKNNINENLQNNILELMRQINAEISGKLGRDYQIGYSYFMKELDYDKIKRVIDYAIIPLIGQYFFGKKENIDNIKNICNAFLIRIQNGYEGDVSLSESLDSFS